MNRTRHARDTTDEEDDARIIAHSVREPERFSAIFDRHAPYIHRYLTRRLGRQVADDLTAETFLAAFHKRSRYDLDRRDARPWLYGIATNLIGQHRRDELRDHRLRQTIAPDRDESGLADRVAAEVSAQALRQPLVSAVTGLSPGDRDVLLLVAWAELTYEEVAEALLIPVGTVRSRLHRARVKLRAALGDINPTNHIEEPVSHG
ncbi:RNA polymerase sigma factor [Micromonospora sp. CPCC 205556]|uniref:RNA polymerase sigma factor n=1 Tax=Micromonospora sp. CPCC 205556 TaxID=3122398 RepID=UPI002FF370F8